MTVCAAPSASPFHGARPRPMHAAPSEGGAITWVWRLGMLVYVCSAAATASEPTSEPGDRPPPPALPARWVAPPRGEVLLIRGAVGTPEYGQQFDSWAAAWRRGAEQGHCRLIEIGNEPDLPAAPRVAGENPAAPPPAELSDTRAKLALRQALSAAAVELEQPLWIVFLGHGTYNGRVAKFNLVGEDMSDRELAEWLAPLRRPVAILQCASASGPFLEALSAPGRVIITSTKSGQEIYFARFGGYLAEALTAAQADLDKDGQVSLLEAFLRASRQTEEFYTGENRLATEHALLDDNGDGRGTRASAYAGVRPVRQADSGASLDGYVAHQWVLVPTAAERDLPPDLRRQRDELEVRILMLRERKASLPEDDYYRQLEPLLLELARLYEAAERGAAVPFVAP